MKDYQSLNRTKWDCKYHVVFIPKRRRKPNLRGHKKAPGRCVPRIGTGQKESKIMEGHLCSDHVHMCLSIPPKFAVSSVFGYIKGKSAISIARNFRVRKPNFTGESFWARGFYVSTLGLDEEGVRKYIRDQEAEDTRLEQLNLVHNETPPSGGD